MLLPSAVIIYSRFKSKGLYSKMSFSLCKPNENYMILIKSSTALKVEPRGRMQSSLQMQPYMSSARLCRPLVCSMM